MEHLLFHMSMVGVDVYSMQTVDIFYAISETSTSPFKKTLDGWGPGMLTAGSRASM